MTKIFEEIEFTPEMIYEELLKAGIEIELNEDFKYLEEKYKNQINIFDQILKEKNFPTNNEYSIYSSKNDFYNATINHTEISYIPAA